MDKGKLLLVTLLSLLCTTPAIADEVIKESAGGGINWSEGIVFAHGYGTAKPNLSAAQRRILSRRAAVVDGQRNLLELTKGVRINSEATVEDEIVKGRVTVTRIEGMIKGAVITKENFQNDIYTVTLAMPMAGQFLRAVWQDEKSIATSNQQGWKFDLAQLARTGHSLLSNYQLIPSAYADDLFTVQDDSEAKTVRKLMEWLQQSGDLGAADRLGKSLVAFEQNSVFSGLLINASTVPQFELATIPKIRNEEGEVIYPSESTSYDDIVNKRGVSYDFDLEDAIRNQRVATTPFIIEATSTYKSLASDLVISNEDAQRIVASTGTRDAMNKAGVLIVVAI